MLSLVFPIKSITKTSDVIDGNNNDINSLLLISNHMRCKSSIVFQLMVSVVTNHYEEVHYITNTVITEIPIAINDMPIIDTTNGSALNFLKIYYLDTYDSLVNHLLGIQSSKLSPIAIVVDNIFHFVKQYNQQIEKSEDNEPRNKRHKSHNKDYKELMAELSALLINTANNCRQKNNKKCLLVSVFLPTDNSSIDSYDYLMAEAIGNRFFSNVWTIHRKTPLVSLHQLDYQMDCKATDCQMIIDFNLKQKQIFLDRISLKK